MRATCLSLLLLPCAALSQVGGPGQFPQFRSMSGLPGSGYGIRADGSCDPMGAWSISTPIAYSLKPWQLVASAGSLSPNSSFRFLDSSSGESTSNGTAAFTIGLPLGKYGQGTYTLMVLSGKLDNASNFTWTPPGQSGPVRFGIGVQDIGGGGGTQGEGPNHQDPGNSRSWYGVATYEGPKGIHASIGGGSNRFDSVFGNASANITPNLKGVVEYDVFNWNVGLGYDLGRLGASPRPGADLGASMFVGLVRGKYAYWSVSIRF
ncbi:MAG: hypothetical protein JSS66_12180 [Armatimonadetes bacterium]|nr:hypothetical protein [Armatimonadota bacterium]